MIAIIISVALLAIAITGFGLGIFLSYDHDALTIISFVVAVICLLGFVFSLIGTVNYISYAITPEAHIQRVQMRRAAYVELLEKYSVLSVNDLTASTSYLELYDRVCDFNSEVYSAQIYGDNTHMAGLLYDPSYVGIEPIEIN